MAPLRVRPFKKAPLAAARIEEIVGWLKTVAGLRRSKFRGLDRVGMSFTFALAAYNPIRMPGLLAEVEP